MENQNMQLPPANINKLKGILKQSKNIMQKVESGNYKKGNIDSRALTETGVQELMESGVKRPTRQAQTFNHDDYTNKVNSSKMPDIVKRAMLENHIPQVDPSSVMNKTFSIDDVEDLIDEDYSNENNATYTRSSLNTNNSNNTQRKGITENLVYTGSKTITINEDELRGMLKEMVKTEVEREVSKVKDQIKEAAIKQTITTLIKEGKLKITKKT